jgi:hypothetical protein
MERALYQYPPLTQEKSIRLLLLQPATSKQAPLICEIHHAELGDGKIPPYEALSYVWGSVTDTTHRLICSGQHVSITRNLNEALLHLRYTDRVRVLWVDAVCVDQSNVSERNHQVCQMGEIYQQASQVVVWLGAGDPLEDYSFCAFMLHAEVLKHYRLAAMVIKKVFRDRIATDCKYLWYLRKKSL